MFVVTADQKDSRTDIDRAGRVREELNREFADALVLPVDRTAGDEIQALLSEASAALAMVLDLTRRAYWSVGLGIGGVRTPLPAATREATGPAFIAARDAVAAAKKSPTRFALAVGRDADAAPRIDTASNNAEDGNTQDTTTDTGDTEGETTVDGGIPGTGTGDSSRTVGTAHTNGTTDTGTVIDAVTPGEVEALINLLLLARERRTPQGWEVADLIDTADSQRDVARTLRVTPQAVSTRLRTSGWRTEQAAVPGLVKLLARLDSAQTRKDSPA